VDKRRIQLLTGLGVEVLEAGPPAADGGRPLLLVHGFTGAKEDFADHLDLLGELGWHAVAPDLRGHGGSDAPSGTDAYSFRLFAADVLEVADALGWERFTLLGHSMGGMIVQHVALDATDRLDGLILMDTSHAAPDGLDPEMLELGKTIVRDGGMQALVEVQRGMDGALDTPANQRVVAERPGYQEWGESKSLASSPDMWVTMVDEMVSQPDRLGALATLPAALPVLILVGEQDGPFLGHAERMAGAIPGARLVVLPDAGHSPQFENPAAWFAALTGFLADVAEGVRR
jgi:2-succinyl-6-hydroxy-2,4-cyclohexadiene-1-carboxylate synthase